MLKDITKTHTSEVSQPPDIALIKPPHLEHKAVDALSQPSANLENTLLDVPTGDVATDIKPAASLANAEAIDTLSFPNQPSQGKSSIPSSDSDGFYFDQESKQMLNTNLATTSAEPAFFRANEGVSLEQALVQASELLRCATATAYECGDNLKGSQRDLAFLVMHLVQMVQTLVDKKSLDNLPLRN